MELDSFKYPINEPQLATHIKANRLGKIRNNQGVSNYQCPDCGRKASDCPKFSCSQREEDRERRYGVYGPNCIIYLGAIKRVAIFMFLCSILFAIPMLVMNLSGHVCHQGNACASNDLLYKSSVYNVFGLQPGSLPHAILWLVFCVLMSLFTIYLRKYIMQTYRKINNRNTTDSDYSLLLRRLPPQTTPDDIKLLFERQIAINQNDYNHFSGQNPINLAMRDILMVYETDTIYQYHKQQVKEFKEIKKDNENALYAPNPLPQPVNFANAALVRFFDKRANQFIERTTQSSCKEKILNYFCVFYNPRTQYKIRDTNIAIENAPHPTDMLWKNFGYSQRDRIMRKIVLSMIAIGVLCISSGISLGISFWIQKLTQNYGWEPIYLTLLTVLVTLAFNKVIKKIVTSWVKQERLDTKTDQQSQEILLITIHQSLNLGFFSVLAPFLVKLPQEIEEKTIKSSNFPVVMLMLITAQGILANIAHFIIKYFELKQKFSRTLHNRHISIKTQTEASYKFKGTSIPFVKAYCFVIKMVWFGFLYGVVSPLCTFIATIGMLLFYLFEKILYNSKYSIPFYGGPRINYQLMSLLDWTPLLIALFNFYLYKISQNRLNFKADNRVDPILWTMIGFGIIHLVMPWKQLVKKCIKTTDQDDVNYLYDPRGLQITYQQSNPVMRRTQNIIHREGGYMEPKQNIAYQNTNRNLSNPSQYPTGASSPHANTKWITWQ